MERAVLRRIDWQVAEAQAGLHCNDSQEEGDQKNKSLSPAISQMVLIISGPRSDRPYLCDHRLLRRLSDVQVYDPGHCRTLVLLHSGAEASNLVMRERRSLLQDCSTRAADQHHEYHPQKEHCHKSPRQYIG